MRKDGSGLWRCPDCYKPGDDPVSLQRANNARTPRGLNSPMVPGPPPESPTVFEPDVDPVEPDETPITPGVIE
jgi:hypothetical protein